MSATLTDFLRARIAEDEFWAQACAADQHLLVSLRSITETAPLPGPEVTHIIRWDPARVLAECAAKRAIVEEHKCSIHRWPKWDGTLEEELLVCYSCAGGSEINAPYPCDTLRALAAVYTDHPEFRAEWR